MFKIFDKKTMFVKILVTFCLISLWWNICLSYENDRLLTKFNRSFELFKFGYTSDLVKILRFTNLVATTMEDNDKNIIEMICDVEDNLEILKDEQQKLERTLLTTKKINIDNVENIIKANLLIVNETRGYKGSGTHIKINGKSYVLTCAHLIKKHGNELVAITDMGDVYPLSYVKRNTKLDLGLFEIKGIEHLPYLEISDEIPQKGSEVLVVGNPSHWLDVITNGVIAKELPNKYCLTNLAYFGSSGGAVLYKGKIVGVVTLLHTEFDWSFKKKEIPAFVSWTIAIKLDTIKKFLEGVE